MRITINPRLDMETLTWVGNDGVYEWNGPVLSCKGDPIAQQQEQAQATFDNTLTNIFQQQYSNQQNQLQYLQSQMEPVIAMGGQGYTPTQLTSLETGATDTNSQQFQNAEAALNNQISQNAGGSKLAGVAGASIEAQAQLQNAEAQIQAASQQQIQQQNAQLQQQNYWNAVNALNGVAAQENPLGYAGAETGGANAVTGLSQAVTSSNQSQLLGALGGIAGGIGGALSGTNFMKNLCWVAASFWGWNDARTHTVRAWMLNDAPDWFRRLYITHGQWISRTPLRWAFRPVFEYILETA